MRGQASIEYVVVVALVVAVTAVASTIAAPGIANSVVRAVRHALCVVGGGDCLATEKQPCVTTTAERSEGVTVDAFVFRLGHSSAILRREMSDGTVSVTVIDDLSSGVGAGFGLNGRLQVRGIDLAGGGMLQASALARLGTTTTFEAGDSRAADRLMKRLMDGAAGSTTIGSIRRFVGGLFGGGDDGPRPDSRTFSAGAEGEVSAALRGFPLTAEVSAGLSASLGGSVESRTGRRTLFFEVGGETAGALKALLAQGRVGGGSSVGLALTYDRVGRPLTLSASVSGEATAGVGALDAMPGVPRPEAARGHRVEIDAALDLGGSDNAALARRLIGGLDPRHPRPGAAAAAAREIGTRLVREGDVDVRSYRSSSSSQGVGAGAAFGAKLGADVDVTHSSSRLRSAWSRPAGGVWERRIDCAPGAIA